MSGAAERAAERLLQEKDQLAREITEALYGERPELLARYGAAGREKCLQDMRFNLEHLAPAVALGEDALFVGYVTWLVGLLAAREIPGGEVARSLELTADAIERRFPSEEAASVRPVLAAGRRVLGGADGEAHGR